MLVLSCYLWKILLIRLADLEGWFTSVSVTHFWSDLAPLWLRKTSRALRDNPFIPDPGFSLTDPRLDPGVGGRPVRLKLFGSWSRLCDLTRRDPRDSFNFPSNSLKVGLLTMYLDPVSEAISLESQSGPEQGMGVDNSELFRLSLTSLVLVFLVRFFCFWCRICYCSRSLNILIFVTRKNLCCSKSCIVRSVLCYTVLKFINSCSWRLVFYDRCTVYLKLQLRSTNFVYLKLQLRSTNFVYLKLQLRSTNFVYLKLVFNLSAEP